MTDDELNLKMAELCGLYYDGGSPPPIGVIAMKTKLWLQQPYQKPIEWHPATSIQQCFDYVVPAMESKGAYLYMKPIDAIAYMGRAVWFACGDSSLGTLYGKPTITPRLICEAAWEAWQATQLNKSAEDDLTG